MGEPSRSQAVHEVVQTRGLSLPLAGSLPTSAGGDPEQQVVSSAGDGGGDGRSALIAALARETAGGPLATPEAYFEHFTVFDPKRHKVRPGRGLQDPLTSQTLGLLNSANLRSPSPPHFYALQYLLMHAVQHVCKDGCNVLCS